MKEVGGVTETAKAEHERWMLLAIEEAEAAAEAGEVPVGAVAVLNGELLGRNHNRSIELNDPTAHAEILVLREAGRLLGNYRLPGLDLYVTIEPCLMCTGAIVWARIGRLIYGARDAKAGAVVSKSEGNLAGLFNHAVPVVEGILEDRCREVIQLFFARLRMQQPGIPV